MYKGMAFCFFVIKKLMNTATMNTETGINAAKKFGDKYGKNLINTTKKPGLDRAKIASKRVVQKLQKRQEI